MKMPCSPAEFLEYLKNDLNEAKEDYVDEKREFKHAWKGLNGENLLKADKKAKKRAKAKLKKLKYSIEFLAEMILNIEADFDDRRWLETKVATKTDPLKGLQLLAAIRADDEETVVGDLYFKRR